MRPGSNDTANHRQTPRPALFQILHTQRRILEQATADIGLRVPLVGATAGSASVGSTCWNMWLEVMRVELPEEFVFGFEVAHSLAASCAANGAL